MDELHALTFGMGIQWEALSGDTIGAKATALMEYAMRNNKVAELARAIEQARGKQ